MRANQVLVATAHGNGIITLSGMHENKLVIVGASIGNMPGENYYSNSHSFSIEKGQTGMVAVIVQTREGTGKHQRTDSCSFFLGVSWENKEGSAPKIVLDAEWVPSDPGRLGCFYFDNVETVIDGITYSTSVHSKDDARKRYVPNANLICRYMDSKIDAAALDEAIGAPAKQAAELERLRNENAALRSQNEQLDRTRLNNEALVTGLRAALRRQITNLAIWKMALVGLKIAVSKQWFQSKAVKAALAHIKRKEKPADDELLQADCIVAEMSFTDLAAMVRD